MEEDENWQLRRCQCVCVTAYVPISDSYSLQTWIPFTYIPFINTYITGSNLITHIVSTVPWARIEYHNFMPKKRWNSTYSRLEKHY